MIRSLPIITIRIAFPANIVHGQTTIPVLPVTVVIGKTKDLTDGFWDFLKPLHIGKHENDFTNRIDPRGVNNSNS